MRLLLLVMLFSLKASAQNIPLSISDSNETFVISNLYWDNKEKTDTVKVVILAVDTSTIDFSGSGKVLWTTGYCVKHTSSFSYREELLWHDKKPFDRSTMFAITYRARKGEGSLWFER